MDEEEEHEEDDIKVAKIDINKTKQSKISGHQKK